MRGHWLEQNGQTKKDIKETLTDTEIELGCMVSYVEFPFIESFIFLSNGSERMRKCARARQNFCPVNCAYMHEGGAGNNTLPNGCSLARAFTP